MRQADAATVPLNPSAGNSVRTEMYAPADAPSVFTKYSVPTDCPTFFERDTAYPTSKGRDAPMSVVGSSSNKNATRPVVRWPMTPVIPATLSNRPRLR